MKVRLGVWKDGVLVVSLTMEGDAEAIEKIIEAIKKLGLQVA